MNINEAAALLKTAMGPGIAIMLWGPPGIGKSAIVRQAAREGGLELIDLRLAQLDATDLRGIPVPEHEKRRVAWYAPAFLPRAGKGILFLDEIDKASTLVKNAALQLVLDRNVGDYRLPDGWAIIAAANREEDGAFAAPLGAALANRMLHLEVEPDAEAWISWARRNGIHEDIVAFLGFRGELLYKQTGDHAFPSPRSWEAASKLLETAGEIEIRRDLIAAAVGPLVAAEFMGWAAVYRAVNVEEVLAGKLPKFKEGDASFRYALALAVSSHIAKRGLPPSGFRHLAALLEALTPELRVVLFRNLPADLLSRLAAHPALRAAASKVVLDYARG